ncbi:WD40 repeat domain-containing protein [Salinisphaera sp. G21_0]|uniref:WD40 repeat domain-containing protein n=1 Tax=Salinisphaera sp. G21_0 TaxID=2821094 RepID=UPI001ADD167A|nr:WD40 repeat domain-containing protein [Salinisphaera sp. G21_0]MBO9481725.1 WD40 repeat domain-containing protein [Salinisphaera sp. G21_0]
MQPAAQSCLRSLDGSGLKKDEEALITSLKPISGLVANFNKRISEAPEMGQKKSLKRLKEHLPPGWTISTETSFVNRKLEEIVGLNFSTNRLSPGTTPQQSGISTIQCDSRIEPGNIDPGTSEIFQCQTNYLTFQMKAHFGCYILQTYFSPSGKHLFISGCDSLKDHSLVSWLQDANGNWSENSRTRVGAQKIIPQLNRSENTLLTIFCQDGKVKVSTLNSDGRWVESRVLEHLPLAGGYEPVMASFNPVQDKIMTYDQRAGRINVLRLDGSRWTLLDQPTEIRQSGPRALNFVPTNTFLMTQNVEKATIWHLNDQRNCIVPEFVKECDRMISDCQLSRDESHALVLLDNRVFFLAHDADGNWSQVGEVHHSEQPAEIRQGVSVPNRICSASLNPSGQFALTRDLARKTKISGYDVNDDWVEKIEIPSCDNASFTRSGWKVLADFGGGSFKIWNCRVTGNLDKPQTLEHTGSDRPIFSRSEKQLLSYGNETNYACIWGDDEEGNLIQKARVCHQGGVMVADFNVKEDSVLTVGHDCTVKIQGLDIDGEWLERLEVKHQNPIEIAQFSPSGRLAFSVSRDSTVCIMGRDDKGKWTQQALTKPGTCLIKFAQFNKLENHFLTFGKDYKDHNKPGFVQLWRIGDDGKWAEEELIKLNHPVKMADFSPDGDHLIIHCKNNPGGVPKGDTVLLWKIPASLPRQPLDNP